MQVIGPSDLVQVGAAMAGVIGLGVGIGFATHCVAYLSVVFMSFVNEGAKK